MNKDKNLIRSGFRFLGEGTPLQVYVGMGEVSPAQPSTKTIRGMRNRVRAAEANYVQNLFKFNKQRAAEEKDANELERARHKQNVEYYIKSGGNPQSTALLAVATVLQKYSSIRQGQRPDELKSSIKAEGESIQASRNAVGSLEEYQRQGQKYNNMSPEDLENLDDASVAAHYEWMQDGEKYLQQGASFFPQIKDSLLMIDDNDNDFANARAHQLIRDFQLAYEPENIDVVMEYVSENKEDYKEKQKKYYKLRKSLQTNTVTLRVIDMLEANKIDPSDTLAKWRIEAAKDPGVLAQFQGAIADYLSGDIENLEFNHMSALNTQILVTGLSQVKEIVGGTNVSDRDVDNVLLMSYLAGSATSWREKRGETEQMIQEDIARLRGYSPQDKIYWGAVKDHLNNGDKLVEYTRGEDGIFYLNKDFSAEDIEEEDEAVLEVDTNINSGGPKEVKKKMDEIDLDAFIPRGLEGEFYSTPRGEVEVQRKVPLQLKASTDVSRPQAMSFWKIHEISDKISLGTLAAMMFVDDTDAQSAYRVAQLDPDLELIPGTDTLFHKPSGRYYSIDDDDDTSIGSLDMVRMVGWFIPGFMGIKLGLRAVKASKYARRALMGGGTTAGYTLRATALTSAYESTRGIIRSKSGGVDYDLVRDTIVPGMAGGAMPLIGAGIGKVISGTKKLLPKTGGGPKEVAEASSSVVKNLPPKPLAQADEPFSSLSDGALIRGQKAFEENIGMERFQSPRKVWRALRAAGNAMERRVDKARWARIGKQIWNIPYNPAINFGKLINKDALIAQNLLDDFSEAHIIPLVKHISLLDPSKRYPAFQEFVAKEGYLAIDERNIKEQLERVMNSITSSRADYVSLRNNITTNTDLTLHRDFAVARGREVFVDTPALQKIMIKKRGVDQVNSMRQLFREAINHNRGVKGSEGVLETLKNMEGVKTLYDLDLVRINLQQEIAKLPINTKPKQTMQDFLWGLYEVGRGQEKIYSTRATPQAKNIFSIMDSKGENAELYRGAVRVYEENSAFREILTGMPQKLKKEVEDVFALSTSRKGSVDVSVKEAYSSLTAAMDYFVERGNPQAAEEVMLFTQSWFSRHGVNLNEGWRKNFLYQMGFRAIVDPKFKLNRKVFAVVAGQGDRKLEEAAILFDTFDSLSEIKNFTLKHLFTMPTFTSDNLWLLKVLSGGLEKAGAKQSKILEGLHWQSAKGIRPDFASKAYRKAAKELMEKVEFTNVAMYAPHAIAADKAVKDVFAPRLISPESNEKSE